MAGNRISSDPFGISALRLFLVLGLCACLPGEQSPLEVNGRGSIAGTLVGVDLLPIPDAEVALTLDGTELSYVRTDGSGRFAFGDLRAGAYEVRVLLPPGSDTSAQAALLGVEGGRVVVPVSVSAGEASITVGLRSVTQVADAGAASRRPRRCFRQERDMRSTRPGAEWIQEQIDDIAGARIQGVWIGDATNDRQEEVLVTTNAGSLNTGLFLQYECTATGWTRTTIESFPGREPFVRSVGDADNDGKVEVLVTVLIQPVFGNQSAELRLYKHVNGAWQYQTIAQGAAGYYTAAIGDADGDGANDIVVAGYNLGSILLFKFSSGGFVQSQIDNVPQSGWPTSAWPAIGDVMNLGTPQVYVGTHTSGNIYAYRWNGVTWLRTSIEEGTGYVAFPLVGDIDNSGRNSLLVSKYGGAWGLRQYSYAGSTWSSTLVELAERESMSLADINADGRVEIVTVWGNTIYAYARRAQGSWSRNDVTTIDFDAYWLAVGDALNNGKASIVVGQFDGGRVVLLRRSRVDRLD